VPTFQVLLQVTFGLPALESDKQSCFSRYTFNPESLSEPGVTPLRRFEQLPEKD
jgi:hypothetical protein